MNKDVVVDHLNDILESKFKFDLILQYLKGGVAIWDQDLNCVYLSGHLREILGVPDENLPPDFGTDEFLDRDVALDPAQTQHLTKRTYITDRGFCYLDICTQKILDRSGKVLGYLSVCQDVTAQHVPSIFKDRLMSLHKCIAQSESSVLICKMIYQCVELLGFRDLSVFVLDEKKKSLQSVARIIKSLPEELNLRLKLDTQSEHPFIIAAKKWLATSDYTPVIFNEVSPDVSEWPVPFACVPVVNDKTLLGALVFSRTQAHTLTPELLDSLGRTQSFMKELAPVFKRLCQENTLSEIQSKKLIIRSKLEIMNLNQKQIQIIELLARGETNKGIAAAVNLSEQGVKYHIGNLLERFNSKNRFELRTKIYELVKSDV